MKNSYLILLLLCSTIKSFAQAVIDPKGTKIVIDSSKWTLSGNNIYNKNSGNVGIGVSIPLAQLHTTNDVRFSGIGINTSNTKIMTTDGLGNVTTRLLSNLLSGNAITSLNGLTSSVQTYTTGTAGSDFNISSTGSAHAFNFPNASASNRGALTSTDWSTFNGKENALTFSTGLTRSTNTITVNTSQNISTLSNLTSNGLIKTTGGTGALSIATAGTDYSAGTSSLATGILKSTTSTGALSIAIAGDFPTLNQNTTGSAATLTTPRNIHGGSFNGSADLTNIITSTYGGTGNGFAKFSGPATTEKTFTLPNASATILTDNAAVTVAQGGTGQTSYTDGQLLIGNSTGNILTKSTLTAGTGISVTNVGGSITITNTSPSSGGTVTSVAALTLGTSGSDLSSSVANPTTTPVITLNVPTASASNRGVLSFTDWNTFNGKESALTFSTGLTRSTNTITVNTSQNISTLSNLTSNGLIKTSGGTGALSIATAGTEYSAGTSALGTGILKSTTSTGAMTIAIASDFPTLNQNTTGSAATLLTSRNIYGGSFNGSADVTNIIASTYGGTGNGFAKFSGPATSEKTFTLPNANATILTDNATVTVAQGGTGQTSYTDGQLLIGNSTGNTLTKSTLTAGTGISVTNAGGSITIANTASGGTVTSVAALTLGTTGTDLSSSVANPTTTPVITLNVPTASASNRGVLSSTDWSTFNSKQSSLINSAGLAAALSDETGTGLAVFSTSPSLTTPILGVASATSGTITGTGGTGFLELQTQSFAPSSGATNSVRLYSNAGSLAWKRQSDGFVRSFASTLTADRTFTLPDANGTIAVSASGNIALSAVGNVSFTGILPIANGGTNSSTTLNNNRIMVSSGGAITEAAALINGQLLIGSTGAAPVGATLTAGNGITITNAAGSITIANEPTITQATSTTDVTTTSTTDVLLTGMTITPGAGDYLVFFTGSLENTNSDKQGPVSIYQNGTQIAASVITDLSSGNRSQPISTNAYITNLGAGQAIEVKWRVISNTGTFHQRTLIVQKVK